MDDFRLLHSRIDRICARAERADGDPQVIAELNDVLSEGYAEALQAEAELIRIEEQLAAEISRVTAGRAQAVRTLSGRLRAHERAVTRLRARLAVMHERFVALGGAAPPA